MAMNSKQKAVTALVLLIGAVGVLVPAFMLIKGVMALGEADGRLQSTQRQLQSFYDRKPFPSAPNVETERRNAEQVGLWRSNAIERLSVGQFEIPAKTPSTFKNFLYDHLTELGRLAVSNGIVVPRDFPYGFSRYAGGAGELPTTEDQIPTRMAGQLLMIRQLCEALFGERIAELHAVTREEFAAEGSGGARADDPYAAYSRQPNRPAAQPVVTAQDKPRDQFDIHPFSLEFTATEDAFFRVLNRLAASPMLVVVTGVKFDKTGADVLGAPQSAGGEGATAIPAPGAAGGPEALKALTRVQRLVSGPEIEAPLRVKLDVDVYRIKKD